jgi:hypothetical protein
MSQVTVGSAEWYISAGGSQVTPRQIEYLTTVLHGTHSLTHYSSVVRLK